MKKLSLILGAFALVLGLSQCKKTRPDMPQYSGPVGNMYVQQATLKASQHENNSKVADDGLGCVEWEEGDVITVSGGGTGTLTCTDAKGKEGIFTGQIIQTGEGDLIFTYGEFSSVFENQTGTLTKALHLVGTSAFVSSPSGAYDVDMSIDYAVLKLDLSALGTAGDGNEVRIYKEEETNPIATVLNVKDDSKVLYVALPTDNLSTTPDPAEITYRFVGNNKVVNKLWGIKQNTFYTQKEDTGKAIVIAPISPTKASPLSTTLESCVNCQQVLKGKVTPNETQTCEYGLVYSKKSVNADPVLYGTGCTMVKDNAASLSSETEYNFDFDPDDFEKGVEYVVKAYAIGENGTVVYGDARIFDFPAPLPTWTNGENPHPFTVASGKTVHFSQGNLQYYCSTSAPKWRFAEHQFDMADTKGTYHTTKDYGENTGKWIDLFGWGTSGYHQTSDTYNVNYMPYSTRDDDVNQTYNYNGYGPSTNKKPEGPSGQTQTTGNISGSYYDWGVRNAISNGGSTAGMWRTLSKDEWGYLFNNRTNAGNLLGLGKVGCTNGLIILPNDWNWEEIKNLGLRYPDGTDGLKFTVGESEWSNTYSYSEWSKMESLGAVFLPAAGFRNRTGMLNVGSRGFYWSSTYWDSEGAWNLQFYSNKVDREAGSHRHGGVSVRLVR